MQIVRECWMSNSKRTIGVLEQSVDGSWLSADAGDQHGVQCEESARSTTVIAV